MPRPEEVALDRNTVVDNIGTVINPPSAKGQIQGGVAQGAGKRFPRTSSMTATAARR
jgi:CO/xanthine dehydrogenase Mo-binding subunit